MTQTPDAKKTSRWKAASIHLSISILIGAIAFALLYLVYYPEPYFAASGADQLVMILLAVDVILGPLLTLVVFKSGKKSLKFDLGTIATVQFAALIYGLHVMWVARPVYIVGAVDRFVIVYAWELTQADSAQALVPEFRKMPIWGPKLVGLKLPTDPDEQLKLAEQAMSGGGEAEKMPKYFTLYGEVAVEMTKRGKDPLRLLKLPKGELLKEWIDQHPQQSYVYLPLVGRSKSIALLMDNAAATPVRGFDVDPW
jgi:hypothetical protein